MAAATHDQEASGTHQERSRTQDHDRSVGSGAEGTQQSP